MTDPRKLNRALTYLLAWVGEGRKVSAYDKRMTGLIRYAERKGLVRTTTLPHGNFLIEKTGRAP